MFEKKIERCRKSHMIFSKKDGNDGIAHYCKEMEQEVTEEICEKCEKFNSRFIEYPIEVSAIDTEHFTSESYRKNDIGKFVKIKPCGKEYEDKTYLGIYLGDLIISPHISHHPETKVLTVTGMTNPAIFVPELKKIIYGCESWWSIINENTENLEITDENIENTWYVKTMKEMFGKE